MLSMTTLSAQSTTGTVEGRVLNVTSGQYVKNARVTVEGTNLESITNEFGEYRLVDVPGGTATIRAAYGGLPPDTQSVTVATGQSTTQNFSVGGSAQLPQDGSVVKLDEFVVASARETNAAAIATNEQRYAPNIKSRRWKRQMRVRIELRRAGIRVRNGRPGLERGSSQSNWLRERKLLYPRFRRLLRRWRRHTRQRSGIFRQAPEPLY
jgi:hypothetical protein